VTYADLLTLLMVLFLVLWVISRIDLAKFEQFKSGLGDFGNPAAEATGAGAGAAAAAAAGSPDAEVGVGGDYATLTTSTTTSTTTAGQGPGDGTQAGDGPEAGDGAGTGAVLSGTELEQLRADMTATIGSAGFGDVISVELQQRGLVITVTTDDVLFAPASSTLEPRGTALIDIVAGDLSGIGNTIIVEGYTDKRPLHRTGYDNWDLSVDRSVSVVKLLRDSYGLDPGRLAATGYGDQHPVAEGDDEASYARNRRVQIVIVAGDDGDLPSPATLTPEATGEVGQG
jgi:chemotaxis protein MotB